MKQKIVLFISTLAYLLIGTFAFAQAPQSFPYQAVARDNNGNLLTGANIALRFSILDGSNAGPIVYQENHLTTTNTLGLFNLNIGQGVVQSGTFANINWGSGSKFIKVELDPAGGNAFTVMGTTQLLSVPYALYANVPGVAGPQGPIGLTGAQGVQGIPGLTGAQGIQGVAGTNGKTILNGTSNPTSGQGVDGDFFLNTTTNQIFGPKTAGAWGIGTSLVGPQGPAGTGSGLPNGTSIGNTTFWNGISWVVNNNHLFNNGTNVGIGTSTPSASSALDITSTTKGFLMPRMTTIQRDAIPTPASGLQIFNLDDQCIDLYDGSNWIKTCGMKVTGTISDPSHIFGPNSWAPKANAPMPYASIGRSSAIAFTIGNKSYMGTGNGMMGYFNDFHEYDPITNVWTQKANFPGVARANAVAFSIGSKGYVTTGGNGVFVNYDMWEYDPATDAWTQKTNCPGSARFRAQGFSIGGKGYLGLGTDGSSDLNDFWEYNPATDTWTQKANYPGSGRRNTMGLSVNGKGYIGLGTDINGNYYNDVWEYNPTTNAWIAKQVFPSGGFHSMACFTMNGKGYMGTGYNGINDMIDFWEYNATTDTWTSKALYSGSVRKNAVGFAIGNKGYIATGSSGFMEFNDMYEYMDDLTVGNSYSSSIITSNNAVSDGAWTLYNNNVYNSNIGNIGIGTSTPSNKFSVVGQSDFTGNVGIGTSAPSAQFHTTGKVKHEDLSGVGLRQVYADSSGILKTFKLLGDSNNIPQPIPDNSCIGVNSSITLSGLPNSIPSKAISVKLNIAHTYDSDIKAYLLSPNGDILTLLNNNGGGQDNFTNTVLKDNGSGNISGNGPFTGIFKPSGSMNSHCGTIPNVSTFGAIGGGSINPNGTWSLKLFDGLIGDIGTLLSWSIGIDNFSIGADNYMPKWSNGILSDTSLIYDDGYNIGIGKKPYTGVNQPRLTVKDDLAGIVQTNDTVTVGTAIYQNTAIIGSFSNHPLAFNTSPAAGNYPMVLLTNGNVGIGTIAPTSLLSVNGSASKPGGGSWAVFSDKRLKDHITSYDDGLQAVLKMNPVKFHYNKLSGCDTLPEYVGVIAQELQEISPYMINTFQKDSVDYLSVDNSAMTFMLINATKELNSKYEKLNLELIEQKQRNVVLQKQLDELKSNMKK
ncbi:MAG: tail fiber domain-containing protein [Bacteroidetes bacterium]|nr:tail fiber domain-containing protein [Bacteroidota bacterium]